MNEVRLKPEFVKVFRQSVIVGFLVAAFVGYILYATDQTRADFVHHHTSKQCTIIDAKERSGKNASYDWDLDCPGERAERHVGVTEKRFHSATIGQQVSVYTSTKNSEVWEVFEPTEDWHEAKRTFEWLIFVGVCAVLGLFARICWWEARQNEIWLRNAVQVEADVVNITTENVAKSMVIRIHIKFQLDGKEIETSVGGGGKEVSQGFKERKITVWANPQDPKDCRLTNVVNSVEIVSTTEPQQAF